MGNKRVRRLCIIGLLCLSCLAYVSLRDGAFDGEKSVLSNKFDAIAAGSVRNYHDTKSDNYWNLSFDHLNGHVSNTFFMDDDYELRVRSSLETGDMKLAITQGSLFFSPMETIYLSGKSFECQYDLTNWKQGRLKVWIIGEDAGTGSVEVSLVR